MRKRLRATLAAVAFLAPLLAQAGPASASTPTFATLQLAHTADTIVDLNCHPLAGVITLRQQAARYRAMGITGVTDTVVTSWARRSKPTCVVTSSGGHPDLVASWREMRALQATYGWSFVGGSRTYPDLAVESPGRAQWEICGSLADIRAHGLSNGQGEFAFPNNFTNLSLEYVALRCGFDFGRIYKEAESMLEMALPVAKPYWLATYSLNGGACNNPSAPCSKLSTPFRYTDPATLALRLRSDPGHWKVVQGYNFVTGAVSSSTVSWNCTSPNWRDHWSSGSDATEIYCWSDWLRAIASAQGLDWVTPAQMAARRAP